MLCFPFPPPPPPPMAGNKTLRIGENLVDGRCGISVTRERTDGRKGKEKREEARLIYTSAMLAKKEVEIAEKGEREIELLNKFLCCCPISLLAASSLLLWLC